MNKERKVGLGILMAAGLILLLILGIFAAHEARSLKYTIVFNDAKGLQVGDRVRRGDRYGLIRFGSWTDVLSPLTAAAALKARARVRGGSTIVAQLERTEG